MSLGLGDLLDVLLVALLGVGRLVAVAGGLLLAPAASVVGRVEGGALEVHRDRLEDALERALAALFACLRRGVAHALEDLEDVPLRTLVLVDGHRPRLATAQEDSGSAARSELT